MTASPKLADHPRLFVTRTQLQKLRERLAPEDHWLRRSQRNVESIAREAVRGADFAWELNTHNAHLIRARINQTRVVSLLVRYFQTGQRHYRDAAIAHVEAMGRWEYWSWIAWRNRNPSPVANFDLSYGENSATLAIAYDWLHDELTTSQRQRFLDIARERSFAALLRHTRGGRLSRGAGWFGHKTTNWNGVCAGGAGMLALAMLDDLPQARRVLDRVQQSLRPFMTTLTRTGGAWPEGIGYWNYGMRYALMFLLSHENATGRRHPLLHQPATRKTLEFPLDFTPHGVACSFGDVNHWSPLPFHFEAARRLGARSLIPALRHRFRHGPAPDQWPTDAEALVLCRGLGTVSDQKPPRKSGPVVKLYPGMDWAIIADQMPDPELYLCVRGGTTKAPHSHLDLMSFQCVAQGRSMITNVGPAEYLDTTFSPRRWSLFEMGPQSKSTILVDGVGVTYGSSVRTRLVRSQGCVGVRVEGAEAMGVARSGPMARFCGRLFLMLPHQAALVVDRLELRFVNSVESRLITPGRVSIAQAAAVIRNGPATLNIALASDQPATLYRSQTTPTTPSAPTHRVLRWCSDRKHGEVTFAMLLSPGPRRVSVSISRSKGRLVVEAMGAGWKRRLHLSNHLLPRDRG